MKYYIISGEASGDLHGARLIRALRQEDPQARIRAWGGDLMQAEGAEIVKHYRNLAIMGIVQVIKKIFTIWRNFRFCFQDINNYKPDVLILIDYSGFNLRVAKWAKTNGYRVFYYISPQVWATRAGRVKKIKKYVDKMFCILPFEQDFYRKYDYKVDFIGHPLLDVVAEYKVNPLFTQQHQLDTQKPIVALLPGSRRQEIKSMLPVMLSVVPRFEGCQFVVAGAPALNYDFYAPMLAAYPQVKWVQHQTYDLLANSRAALVTSGTATLETALWRVPQVVCYKAGALLYYIVKNIIKIPYLSLVNIISNKLVVKELLQGDFTSEKLAAQLKHLLEDNYRQAILDDYERLHQMLGNKGAAERGARKMIEALSAENIDGN